MNESLFERRKISTSFPPNVTAKWSVEVLDEGFVPFPKRLLRSLPKVFKGEHVAEDLAVVLAIVDFRRPNLTRGPSIDFLAFNSGLTKELFLARVKNLEKRGLVKRDGASDEAVSFDLTGLEEAIQKYTPEEG